MDRTLKPALMSVLDIQALIDVRTRTHVNYAASLTRPKQPRPLTAADNAPSTEGSLSAEGSRAILKGLARDLFESLVRNAEVLPSYVVPVPLSATLVCAHVVYGLWSLCLRV